MMDVRENGRAQNHGTRGMSANGGHRDTEIVPAAAKSEGDADHDDCANDPRPDFHKRLALSAQIAAGDIRQSANRVGRQQQSCIRNRTAKTGAEDEHHQRFEHNQKCRRALPTESPVRRLPPRSLGPW